MNKIFIHPTVLFSAVYGKFTDSAAIFNLAADKKIELISSILAISETKKNLDNQKNEGSLSSFFLFTSYFSFLEKSNQSENKAKIDINLPEKEINYLKQALKNNCSVFLTLNSGYFSPEMSKKDLGIAVLTPDSFLLEYTQKPDKTQTALF